MLNSLKIRLLLMTSIILIVLAFVGGFLLIESFSLAQMNALKERLKVHSYSLLAQVEYQEGNLLLPNKLSDQSFNSEYSGLYAIILDSNQQRVWASISAETLPNFSATDILVGQWQYSLAYNNNTELFIARYGISLGSNKENRFHVLLIEDMKTLNQDLSQYRSTLITLLVSTAIFLFLMQLFILRWGLKPLNQLTHDLKDIQLGEKSKLQGHYPQELIPLTSNLNHLLKIEQGQRERYRNSLTDLSHSLKTPISVIQSLLYHDPLNNEDKEYLQQQIDKMTRTIRYQLQRAVNGFQGLSINKIPVVPMVNSLIHAMYKVYVDKEIHIQADMKGEYYFHGDEHDLMEVIGNLLDNACKYCKHTVTIKIEQKNERLILQFSDDGYGIPTQQRDSILQRGVRLDTVEAGQGMGLALVKEILDAYHASIDITDSLLGGTCFIICFNTQITRYH